MNQEKLDENRYDLERFVTAQQNVYSTALAQLKDGQKQPDSHWMWFIFPQVDGLGRSPKSKQYSIKSLDEAEAYLNHPVLGKRLAECAEALLNVDGRSAFQIFGNPDESKLKSSMTLFEQVSNNASVFTLVLEKFFNGNRDERTLEFLRKTPALKVKADTLKESGHEEPDLQNSPRKKQTETELLLARLSRDEEGWRRDEERILERRRRRAAGEEVGRDPFIYDDLDEA